MNHSMLFLAQSYQDAQDEYRRVLLQPERPRWDYIILTASDAHQAEGYRLQLRQRAEAGLLPQGTHFAVIPDEGDERVGSGGATLSVLRYIAGREGRGDFEGLRVMVIHSGGDSKRVPQYSALGKLFSPVPHAMDGRPSTLFDEFMVSMSALPGRIGAGMLLLSGDVLLLFNPLLVDYNGRGAAAISFKEAVGTGKNHGVYLRGEDGYVRRFLHKQSEETLSRLGAVNARGEVDIDTGSLIFSPAMLAALYALVDTEEKYRALVNPVVRLSLYGDFQYPLAADATLEDFYREAPEGSFTEELHAARTLVWQALRPFRMKLLRLAPAKFIHFGTTREILSLMTRGIGAYADLGWEPQVHCAFTGRAAGYSSVLSTDQVGEDVYLETSCVHSGAVIGSRVVLSFVDIHDEVIPDGVVLHALKQRDGRFVCRIWGVEDNPKEAVLFGQPLPETLARLGVPAEEVWAEGEPRVLWTARLYRPCATIREAVAAALRLHRLLTAGTGKAAGGAWQECVSLRDGFHEADPEAIIAWEKRMAELVQMNCIRRAIAESRPARELRGFLTAPLTPIQRGWLEDQCRKAADFSLPMRLHYYTGVALGGAEGEQEISRCFAVLSDAILTETRRQLHSRSNARIAMDRCEVRLPLRVNFGGGWSDTPPYCHEHGGTVLNAAIRLRGERPVTVTLERLEEPVIIFDSRDMDVHGEFDRVEPLQRTGDPSDPFVLQKAALLSCGVIPAAGGDLRDILSRLGGGFRMRSEVTGVPKGSGLGTSSILAGACVKALLAFTGQACAQETLYATVLAMEQLMSTGGGWQDQAGSLTPGLKFITARPGLRQELQVETLRLDSAVWEELQARFALIYTGQRRLARNLLRDVVGRYVGHEPESLHALNEIQRVAALMRFELLRGHVDDFARLLTEHWALSRQIDAGSTNTLIDQIFASIDSLIDGRMICGAGGGGFLQVVMKRGVTAAQLRARLKEVFADADVDVWDCTFERDDQE